MLIAMLAAKKRMVITIFAASAVFSALVCYFINDSNNYSYSKEVSDALVSLRINETLYLNGFLNVGVSLEGEKDCNLNGTVRCHSTDKSLVLSFWRENSRNKWLVQNFLKIFDEHHFTRVIMIHNSSNWSSYPNRELIIWIHVNGQKRFWYLKRFLTPVVLKSYKYIWVVDDDVELLFNPLHYECVINVLNVSLSAPGRMKGAVSHQITRMSNNFTGTVGRWTDFVEIGPIVVGSSSAWVCLWHFLSSFVGLGWGFDLIWCKLLVHKCRLNTTVEHSCAILDIFQVNHLSEHVRSTAAGSQELPAYNQYYKKFHSMRKNIGPLAWNHTTYLACNKSRW